MANNNDTTNARMKIHYDGYVAVLSMSDKDKNTWLLTGWEDEKTAQKKEVPVSANGEGNGSTAATPDMPMRTRHAEETDTSSTPTVPQNQQNVKENPNTTVTVGNKVEDSNEHTEQEPRAKNSKDAGNQLDNQGEKAENEDDDVAGFEGIEPIPQTMLNQHLTFLEEQENVKETVYQQLSDSVKDFSKLVDHVQLDRAFADLPLTRRMRVEFNTKYVQNNEYDKNYYAVRYEHARRCFINDPRIKECIAKYVHEHAKQVRMAKAAQGTLSRSRGTGNKRDVQQTDSKSVVTPSLGEYKGIKEQFDNLIKKHSRDMSAFSFVGNPLSEEALKAKAEFETPLDKNLNSNVPARRIFMHEFVHWLKASGKTNNEIFTSLDSVIET